MAPVINFAFPLIKHAFADLDYDLKNFGVSINKGHLVVNTSNVTLDGAFKFTTTSKGHIYPQLLDLQVDWSNTYIVDP